MSEKLAGELFWWTDAIVRVNGRLFVRGHVHAISSDEHFEVYLRSSRAKQPIPYSCMSLRGVTNLVIPNSAEFVCEPSNGLPMHILTHGDVSFWEAYRDELVTSEHARHDTEYLRMLDEDAKRFFDGEVDAGM